MNNQHKNFDGLEGIDESKRATLRKMVVAAAFATPVVASFSVDAISISSALAQTSNTSGGGGGGATSS